MGAHISVRQLASAACGRIRKDGTGLADHSMNGPEDMRALDKKD